MNVSELIESVNTLTDESLPPNQIVGFLNDALAKINAEVSANFPYFSLKDQDQEPVFSEKWQRLLLIPFAAAKVKQMDSSQFEYQDLYQQFFIELAEFKAKYTVPDEYKDTSVSESYPPSFVGHIFEGGDW